MFTNLNNKILWLILVFFIAPYGFGLTSFPGLQSLDLPKIISFVFFIIIILKFDFRKIDISILFFLLLVLLHFFSIFYSFQLGSSLFEFFSNFLLIYPGFLIPFLIIKSKSSLKKLMIVINIVFISYVCFSILEFVLQINFFDFFRNTYTDSSRFYNNLGFVRLGFKAAMGPFGSTLPFAYTLLALFFLRDLYVPKKLNNKYLKNITTVFGVFAIFFTLSRAAIFILLFFIIYKNFFNSKFRTKLLFAFSLITISIFVWNQIKNSPFETYIETYIFDIKDSSAGTDLRLNNNIIDLNFALERPILGHGAGMLRYNKIDGIELGSSDSSFLLTIFADRGFLSISILLIIILITFKRYYFLFKIKSEDFDYRSLFLGFIALFLCLNSSQRTEVMFLFFFILGMINKIYLINKNPC